MAINLEVAPQKKAGAQGRAEEKGKTRPAQCPDGMNDGEPSVNKRVALNSMTRDLV
jgi:hypothetical protein